MKGLHGRKSLQQLDWLIKHGSINKINFGGKERGSTLQKCTQRWLPFRLASAFLGLCWTDAYFVLTIRGVNDLNKLIKKLMNGGLGRLLMILQSARYWIFRC